MLDTTVGMKAERCVLNAPLSPQQVSEAQMYDARRAMDAFFSETTQDDDDIVVGVTTDEEQNQDSKQPNEWKNPKVGGRLKPTRKGSTKETNIEEG